MWICEKTNVLYIFFHACPLSVVFFLCIFLIIKITTVIFIGITPFTLVKLPDYLQIRYRLQYFLIRRSISISNAYWWSGFYGNDL